MFRLILTITLNPAVDISYPLDRLLLDTVNRVSDVSKTAGGKGLNVARVVQQIGEEVGASGFLGGALGTFIQSEIKKANIRDYFVPIAGETRNCIAILHEGKQTEILEGGPTISEEEADKFIEEYTASLKEIDIIAISGSLPAGLTADFYSRLIKIANDQEKRVLLDVNGSLLQEILQKDEKPFAIKPNEEELAELVGKEKVEKDDVKEIITSPLFAGIPLVVVTLGKEGSIVKYRDKFYEVQIPTVEAVNPVGSGDAVIAGLSVGLARNMPVDQLLAYGMTMGILNAVEEKTGSINPDNIDQVLEQVLVRSI